MLVFKKILTIVIIVQSMRRHKVVIWIFTSKCNLDCLHCYAKRFSLDHELSLDDKLRIVEAFREVNIQHVGLSGGEVTIHKHFEPVLRKLYSENLSISLVTNAICINDKIAGLLRKCDVFVYISLDGDKESHEGLRGRGTWDRTIRGIETLRKHGVNFGTVMAIGKLNFSKVESFIETSLKLEAERINIIPIMPSGKARLNNVYIDSLTFKKVLEKLDSITKTLNINVNVWCAPFTYLIAKSGRLRTFSCKLAPSVDLDPSGNLLLCDVIDYVVSRVVEGNFKKAYHEYVSNDVVNKLLASIPEECKDCEIADYCRGGCFARSYLSSGNLFKPDPLCPRVNNLISEQSFNL